MRQSLISPEYFAAISALGAIIACAGSFAWVTPIMNYFFDPQSDMHMSSAQVGFMISVLELGGLVISVPSGMLTDRLGRKKCILISGPLYTVCWLVILSWKSYTVLCIMRLIQGMAGGLAFTAVPLYLGEISTTSRRGALTGLFTFAFFFGYLIEYIVGPFIPYLHYTLFTASIPVIFAVPFAFQPESPYYLVMKGKDEEAKKSLEWLRRGCSEENVKNELEKIKESIHLELKNKPCWRDVVRTPADRKALFIMLYIGATRIFSGAIAFMSYSTKLFLDSGFTVVSPDIFTILFGLSLVLGSLCNTCVVDSLGRRPLLMISYLGCFFSMFVVGTYFYFKEALGIDVTQYGWAVPFAMISYSIFTVVGMCPISMTYMSELFTAQTRGKAASISTVNLTITSFICIELYQIVDDYVGLYAVFWFYAIVCLIGLVGLYIIAPETKGKTFSEIRAILDKSKTKTNAGVNC